jgi:signal transduction histidine kinase
LRDGGVGMSATTRGRMFDPFFTTKSPGQAHGLGLHLVYGIVKRHGGAVAVESAQGRGTTVHLLFPGLG